MKLSVCIPMYNEEAVIAATAGTLAEYLDRTFPGDYELIFVNDGSKDGSAAAVESLRLPRVRVISYEPNRGKGYAVRTAMLAAAGDVVFFTDADLAYGTEVIGTFVAAFAEDADLSVAVGSRNLSKDGYGAYSPIRVLASKIYLKVLAVVGGLKLSDSQCGCKAFSRDAARKIFSRCEVDRFAFDFEAILWAQKLRLKMREVPVRVLRHGESKVRILRDSLKMLRDLSAMRKRIKKAEVETHE